MNPSPTRTSTKIDGVQHVPLRPYVDERGQFMETFRREWFPQVSWEKIQTNRSVSVPGVLRGLHYHFKQVDYWFAASGIIRAGMVDLRPNSPTFMATEILEIGDENPMGLFIPIGVAHGFYSVTHSMLIYVVNNYYDGGKDEFGIAWNDPDIKLDWGVEEPLLSPRDAANPNLTQIAKEKLPGV